MREPAFNIRDLMDSSCLVTSIPSTVSNLNLSTETNTSPEKYWLGRLFSYWKGVTFKVVHGLFGEKNMCEATLHHTFQSVPRLNSWAIGPGLLTSISFLAGSSFFWEFPHVFGEIFQPSPVQGCEGWTDFGQEKVDPALRRFFEKRDLTDSTVLKRDSDEHLGN